MQFSQVLRQKPVISILVLMLAVPLLIGLHYLLLGWALLLVSTALAGLLPNATRNQLWTLCIVMGIVGVLPVNTETTFVHFMWAVPCMIAAIAIPYLLLERRYKYGVIKYKLRHGRRWHIYELLYVLVPAGIGYLIIPSYFRHTGSYLNWHVTLGLGNLTILLIGLVLVGVWDEVFFVATVASILRKQLPFWVANMAQAVIFSSFLYDLGFRSWGVFFTYIFALVQCYIFKATNSLLYAITIHVVFDLVLFLGLIHAYFPHDLRIFIIN